MARLIDADAFKDYIMDGIADHEDIPPSQFSIVEAAAKGFLLDIDEQPTISPDEVRGVVLCKDCKWCHAGYCEKYDDLIPWGCANEPWEDWFCADGKRQETIKEEQDED